YGGGFHLRDTTIDRKPIEAKRIHWSGNMRQSTPHHELQTARKSDPGNLDSPKIDSSLNCFLPISRLELPMLLCPTAYSLSRTIRGRRPFQVPVVRAAGLAGPGGPAIGGVHDRAETAHRIADEAGDGAGCR